jgi:hypothetical protein
MKWVDTLRLSLLLSLSLLFIFMLARRFKQQTVAKESPVPLHAELLSLQVMYHPERLRVELRMPRSEVIVPTMLGNDHRPEQVWPTFDLAAGDHVLGLPLTDRAEGDHFLELATSTQRTVRKFSLKRA